MKKQYKYAILTATIYIIIYLICYQFFFIGRGLHKYTPDWTAKNILWIAAILSTLPALFGAYRFSIITVIGYILGVICGELFGKTMRVMQEGKPAMPYHDGWFICIALYIAASVVGIVIEIYISKYKQIK